MRFGGSPLPGHGSPGPQGEAQSLDSLQVYLLVDPEKQLLLAYRRTPEGFVEEEGGEVYIPCLDLTLTAGEAFRL